LQEGSTAKGVFGVKVMMGNRYFGHFVGKLSELPECEEEGIRISEMMEGVFPNLHYIWVTRRNKVLQAISWWRAIQSGKWFWRGEELPTTDKKQDFNFESIDYLVQELVMREASWQEFFTEGGIKPYVVVYEDFVSAYEDVALDIVDYLGIPISQDIVFENRSLIKQSDSKSEEWMKRYRDMKQTQWVSGPWEFVANRSK
ncbi:MAG: Stf0 family sulfotransferase, partial [Candidatus Electrothrix sp.]